MIVVAGVLNHQIINHTNNSTNLKIPVLHQGEARNLLNIKKVAIKVKIVKKEWRSNWAIESIGRKCKKELNNSKDQKNRSSKVNAYVSFLSI